MIVSWNLGVCSFENVLGFDVEANEKPIVRISSAKGSGIKPQRTLSNGKTQGQENQSSTPVERSPKMGNLKEKDTSLVLETKPSLSFDDYFSPEEEMTVKHQLEILDVCSIHEKNEKEKSMKINPNSKTFSWKVGEVLGSGSFGRVYLGMELQSDLLMAVKQVHLPQNDKESIKVASDLQREITILQKYTHPNIVRYYGVELKDSLLNIFMEYMSGGSLAKNIADFGKIPEQAARRYTKQILNGLLYLHYNKIVHRDIKGANILISHSNLMVKLADFGCAKEIAQSKTYRESIKGTPNWMAPEVIQETGGGRFSDIWSLGCTVYEMLVGKPPWHHLNHQFAVLYHIASTQNPPEIPEEISNDAKDFMLSCFK